MKLYLTCLTDTTDLAASFALKKRALSFLPFLLSSSDPCPEGNDDLRFATSVASILHSGSLISFHPSPWVRLPRFVCASLLPTEAPPRPESHDFTCAVPSTLQ